MNILMMADYRTPCSGNFVASLLELAEIMRENGSYIHFIFPENQNGGGYTWTQWLEEHGFPVTLVNDQAPTDEVLEMIKGIIRSNDIHIIHSHFGLYHKLLLMNGKKLGVKVVFHDHMDFSPEISLNKQKFRAFLYSAAYRRQGVHIISVMELKSKAYRMCGKKYGHYVPNALSLRRNTQHETTREEQRDQFGIHPGDKLCFMLGWNKYGKGIDIAIKAVARCRKIDPTLKLGIIGVGTPPTEQVFDWIKAHTGVDPQSDWLCYLPSCEDIFACHRAADVFISSSRQEAFSYALLEAISQNTPVVISDVEGTKWAMQYSKAVTYPVEDSDACAGAIEQALEMGCMGSNYQEVIAQYSIDDWCERIIDIYNKMLAE